MNINNDDRLIGFFLKLICFSPSSSSGAEPKGSDCYDQFSTMQECFSRYPTVYNKTGNDDDDDDELDDATEGENKTKSGIDFGSLGNDNNVDTVDQIEETTASSSSKSDENAEESTTPKSQ